ncbi:hypothetical protein CBM2626_A220066 [Cupriavidus taiwanensis]|uniref:Uncharacterized protein n=1 Tax=Cupriavidus taiwanensis TaxID=164546 RepID=A0A976AWU3_9BURK|nr:hypothetical protein CBM2615_A280352 [Cupriavidus taiwanensis]SOZ57366.1 hypothetical protein CBM2614_A250357 [Cupriavidus taiwanensis]SOZ59743.1 hypothetical protein CBM2613_A250356 [Cupriavidus taiwanensis]SOZ98927.1 hypothetical protein CBM2626_A220066 [Cupriavidus taiwanensis]SPA05832.1 hypothetical protein CBM2625_A200357 [Cupriavidus taiwanensis]
MQAHRIVVLTMYAQERQERLESAPAPQLAPHCTESIATIRDCEYHHPVAIGFMVSVNVVTTTKKGCQAMQLRDRDKRTCWCAR